MCFKPYYNWNAFNTLRLLSKSIRLGVLNLIITGMPSILLVGISREKMSDGFKPYYNWNAFNTLVKKLLNGMQMKVLNLIITGMPSIPLILVEY